MNPMEQAKAIIRQEADAVASMADRIDESFEQAVDQILACKGRVIVTGMGKSGLIGRKIVATLNSTGTSAFYLHPAEALHGDLGLIRPEDILMVLSKSGTMAELEIIFATARRLGVQIIALGGTPGSPLHSQADYFLDCSVEKEASPDNLVPTASSTAALVMGDALAVALLTARGFSADDFARLHPGGALGHRLLKRVSDVHHTGDDIPLVPTDATITQMLVIMTGKRLGCALMVNDDGTIAGIFTDGDLRRLIETSSDSDWMHASAKSVMHATAKTIADSAVLDKALNIMETHAITQLPTVDDKNRLSGIIHLHDILKAKLV